MFLKVKISAGDIRNATLIDIDLSYTAFLRSSIQRCKVCPGDGDGDTR